MFEIRNLMDILVSSIGGDVFSYTFSQLYKRKLSALGNPHQNLDQEKLIWINGEKRRMDDINLNEVYQLIRVSCGLESDCRLLNLLIRYVDFGDSVAHISELTEKELNEIKQKHITILDSILVEVERKININNSEMRAKIESQTEHLCDHYLKKKEVIEELRKWMTYYTTVKGSDIRVRMNINVYISRLKGLMFELRSFLVDNLGFNFEEIEKCAPLAKSRRFKCRRDLVFLKNYEKPVIPLVATYSPQDF